MLAAFLACAVDTSDSGAAPVYACDPLQIVETDVWEDVDLPNVESRDHTPAGVALGDLDGDGLLDALMAYGGGATALRNVDGRLVLEPAWDLDGGPMPPASAVALADLDDDGDLDAFLGREKDQLDLILRNDGAGRFTGEALDRSEGAPSTGALADFDGDGDLDLFIGTTTTDTEGIEVIEGGIDGDGCGLYLQADDGTFTYASDRIPEEVRYGWTFQGSPIDYDADGDLDVYMANDFGAWLIPNQLLINDGDANFAVATDCACDLVMFGMGAAVGDADYDGLPDLYVTDLGGPNLLVNQGDGTFADATMAFGADIPHSETSLTSWGTSFVDLDQDAWIDLAVAFGQLGQPEIVDEIDGDLGWVDGELQPDVTIFGVGEGRFERRDVGFDDPSRTRGLAVGDLDRDGRPDLVTAGKYFLRAWHTEGGCDPGLQITLAGSPGNPHGIGARVQVEVGGRTLTQWMLPSVTGSQSALELYVGLGGAPAADRVTVLWPDGGVTVLDDVPAGPVAVAR
jgi:hypothetical protein